MNERPQTAGSGATSLLGKTIPVVLLALAIYLYLAGFRSIEEGAAKLLALVALAVVLWMDGYITRRGLNDKTRELLFLKGLVVVGISNVPLVMVNGQEVIAQALLLSTESSIYRWLVRIALVAIFLICARLVVEMALTAVKSSKAIAPIKKRN